MDRIRHRTTLRGGDTAHRNMFRCSYLDPRQRQVLQRHRTPFFDWVNNLGGEGGDTAHTLLMRGTIGVGTPHNIERLDLAVVGGWWVGWSSGA